MESIEEERIGKLVIDTAIEVHRELGPGLFESIYESILSYELNTLGLSVRSQVPIPIVYKGLKFEQGFRADLLINNKVIIELKSVERVLCVHKKQLLTYLKLTGCRLGYVLNFGESLMKHGITRLVNGLCEAPLCGLAPSREIS